jgi:hypothetical protein
MKGARKDESVRISKKALFEMQDREAQRHRLRNL